MKNPTLQDKLNYANKVVAELMKEVETLKKEKQRVVDEYHLLLKQSEELPLKLQSEINRLTGETYYNKGDKEIIIRDLTAENYALKAEIERTNRHINIAENALHEKEQPIIYNNYHNCVINK